MPLTTLDERTALVVVDLQNGVLGRPGTPYSAQEVIARTVELASAFRERGLPVVLVRFTIAADGSDGTPGRTETFCVRSASGLYALANATTPLLSV